MRANAWQPRHPRDATRSNPHRPRDAKRSPASRIVPRSSPASRIVPRSNRESSDIRARADCRLRRHSGMRDAFETLTRSLSETLGDGARAAPC
jgi:hypothetical protein